MNLIAMWSLKVCSNEELRYCWYDHWFLRMEVELIVKLVHTQATVFIMVTMTNIGSGGCLSWGSRDYAAPWPHSQVYNGIQQHMFQIIIESTLKNCSLHFNSGPHLQSCIMSQIVELHVVIFCCKSKSASVWIWSDRRLSYSTEKCTRL